MRTEEEIKECISGLAEKPIQNEYVKAEIGCFIKALEWVLKNEKKED